MELARAGEFDIRLVNDDLDSAAAELCEIIRSRFEGSVTTGGRTCSRT